MQNQMSFTRKVVQQIKRRITPLYYEVVYGLITPPNVTTMNWGYAPVTDSLRPRHPNGNESLQYELYWQTFSQLDDPLTADQVVCEISSGRGGGLAFLRSLTAARVIGLERSSAACRYAHKHFGIEVCAASALRLPLRDASVDVFVSVEAAHNYHHDAFIAEIARCLKPGGLIVMADMNYGPVHRVQLKLTDFYARNGLRLDK